MALKKPLFTPKLGVGWFLGGAPFGKNRRIHRKGNIGGGGTDETRVIFNAPLTNSLIPSTAIASAYTFTRTDTDATVTDFEGLVKDVTANEARFVGARRVRNTVTDSTDYTNASNPWKENLTGTITDNGDGSATIAGLSGAVNHVQTETSQLDGEVVTGRSFVVSFEAQPVSSADNGKTIGFRFLTVTGGDFTTGIFTLGTAGSWQRYSMTAWTPSVGGATGLKFGFDGLGATGTQLLMRNYQVEEVTGQAVQLASEYVSVNQGVDHGANQDGVKYFNTENDVSTVNATTRVLTEATGSAIAVATLEGVLVEQASTNLIQQSEQITLSPWQSTTGVRVADTQSSPSGESNGDKFQDDISVGQHSCFQNLVGNLTNGLPYTLSAYFKAAEYQDVVIRCGGAAFPATRSEARYTLTGSGTAQIHNGTPDSFGIELVGNGWYRCWITETTIATAAGTFTFILHNGTSDTYAGITGNGVACWGFQVEQNTLWTSYIPTSGAAATRNAESLSYPNTNILDAEGTLALSFTPNGNTAQYQSGTDRALVGVRGVNNDLLYIEGVVTSGRTVVTDGTNTTSITAMPSLVAGTTVKLAARWSATNTQIDIGQDTTEANASFTGSMAKSAAMRIGYSGVNRANGTYKLLRVYNGAVDDATFTGLTT